MTETPSYNTTLLRAAWRCKCPACGVGSLFAGLLTIRDVCPHCGLDLRGHDTGDGALFFVMTFFCFTTVLGALALEFSVEPPVWVHILVWSVYTIGGSMVLLRPTKALMVGYQYRFRREELNQGCSFQNETT